MKHAGAHDAAQTKTGRGEGSVEKVGNDSINRRAGGGLAGEDRPQKAGSAGGRYPAP